jgi:hypothetical protein
VAADDDEEGPMPWRADPGRSETRWDQGSAPYGQPGGYPVPRSAGPRPRWLLLVALGLALVVVAVVVRYLLF